MPVAEYQRVCCTRIMTYVKFKIHGQKYKVWQRNSVKEITSQISQLEKNISSIFHDLDSYIVKVKSLHEATNSIITYLKIISHSNQIQTWIYTW